MNITVADMKANLSEILRKAANGEEIQITKHGRPYVKLGPALSERPRLPRVGAFEGQFNFHMTDDFDELGPEWDEYVK